ncbi:MAG: UvrD-helicase domain-containing protein, partial [Candidatus Sungbacteria bacterium]|nr:UvrD-helicase domain-containing protein [Candidatus Sungbacteria bacterium]
MAHRVKEDIRQESQTRFADLYLKLNAGQRRAVDTIEGPVMVMAGPGTGKTQVLAMRIANILQQTQMDPWNILCLTFTESGVVAMRQRLLSIIGTPAYYVKIHTFHSFCNEVISEHPELFHWTRGVKVISDIERVMLLRGIVDTLSARSPLKPFGSPYLYFRDIIGNIQDLKQEDISPAEFTDILQKLEKFVASVEGEFGKFVDLKPADRTGGACEAIHEVLIAAAKQAKLPDSMR